MKMNHHQQQRPIFDLIEPPSILRTQISLSKPTKRDVSFSAFLQPNDLILPTKHKANHYSEISIFDAEKYFSGLHDKKGNGTITTKQSDLISVPRLSSVSSMDDGNHGVRSYTTRSFRTTPTASSEASWNSQTGLLSNPPGTAPVSIKNIANSRQNNTRPRNWSLRRKCPCSGEKSIQVEEANTECSIQQKPQLNRAPSGGSSLNSNGTNNNRQNTSPRLSASRIAAPTKTTITTSSSPPPPAPNHNTPNNGYFNLRPQLDHHNQTTIIDQIKNPNLNGISSTITRTFTDTNTATTVTATSNGFTFPVLMSTSPPSIIKPPTLDPPRDSLEVFQPREPPPPPPPITRDRNNHNHNHFPYSPKSRRTSYEDEIGSDASSDLFEIESFSTQTTSYQPRDSMDGDTSSFYGGVRRRSLDEPTTPSVAPTECYAPSEVSVVWSVTTAEGFDRASLTNFSVAAASESEYDGGGGGRRRGGGGGGMLSCRNEKAVTVGPGPVKYSVDLGRIGPDGPQTVSTRNVSGRAQQQQQQPSKPPLGRSRSGYVSGAFAV
ncbi:hypothetical protein Droror1_Dr00009709 [Drosera rotundifolia]